MLAHLSLPSCFFVLLPVFSFHFVLPSVLPIFLLPSPLTRFCSLLPLPFFSSFLLSFLPHFPLPFFLFIPPFCSFSSFFPLFLYFYSVILPFLSSVALLPLFFFLFFLCFFSLIPSCFLSLLSSLFYFSHWPFSSFCLHMFPLIVLSLLGPSKRSPWERNLSASRPSGRWSQEHCESGHWRWAARKANEGRPYRRVSRVHEGGCSLCGTVWKPPLGVLYTQTWISHWESLWGFNSLVLLTCPVWRANTPMFKKKKMPSDWEMQRHHQHDGTVCTDPLHMPSR